MFTQAILLLYGGKRSRHIPVMDDRSLFFIVNDADPLTEVLLARFPDSGDVSPILI